MILLTAVVIGLLAGFVRAKRSKRSFQPVRLKLEWLVIVAILPQLLVFFIPSTSAHVSDTWASIILVSSLSLLLAFCLVNIQQSVSDRQSMAGVEECASPWKTRR